MVIFHSYVSLPEGNANLFLATSSKRHDHFPHGLLEAVWFKMGAAPEVMKVIFLAVAAAQECGTEQCQATELPTCGNWCQDGSAEVGTLELHTSSYVHCSHALIICSFAARVFHHVSIHFPQ